MTRGIVSLFLAQQQMQIIKVVQVCKIDSHHRTVELSLVRDKVLNSSWAWQVLVLEEAEAPILQVIIAVIDK